MSNKNLPDIVVEPITDFTDADLKQIEVYKEEGLPGIATVDEKKLERIMDLYLSGRSYRQIAMAMQMKKSIVLYLSSKFNWFTMRKEYMIDLEQSMRGRLMESRIVHQDFLLQLMNMWQKKISNSMNNYNRTGNVEHVNQIDLKEIDKYLKTMEILHRLSSKEGGSAPSPIGLNLGEGVTIEKKSDGTVDITPKSKTIGEALKAFADFRRETENKPK